jgi:hypothetical protein
VINTIKKLLNVKDEMNFLDKVNVEELERAHGYSILNGLDMIDYSAKIPRKSQEQTLL